MYVQYKMRCHSAGEGEKVGKISKSWPNHPFHQSRLQYLEFEYWQITAVKHKEDVMKTEQRKIFVQYEMSGKIRSGSKQHV